MCYGGDVSRCCIVSLWSCRCLMFFCGVLRVWGDFSGSFLVVLWLFFPVFLRFWGVRVFFSGLVVCLVTSCCLVFFWVCFSGFWGDF